MKKINLIIAACLLFLTTNCKHDNTYTLKYIYDYEEILSNDQKLTLEELYAQHEKSTTNEIVLVTVGNYGEDDNIDLFSNNFKIGHIIGKPDKDNGVLIVFSKKNSEVRITPGKGLLNLDESGTTKYLLDKIMIPKFEKEEYYEGLLDASQKIIKFLESKK